MQKKYAKITILSCILAVSVFGVSVKAEEGTNPLKARTQTNIEARQEIRTERKGEVMEIRKEGKAEIKDLRSQMPMIRREIKSSDSGETFKKMKDEKVEMMKKMKGDIFSARKDALVKQLNISIENLTNIAGRLAERITKAEAAGRNMTDAKASLTIANDKLVKAKAAVTALAAYTPVKTATSTTATSTPEVDVEKPRQIGDAAIKAVKEARDAFKKVLEDIAHNMGLGKGRATTTAEINAAATTTNN